MREEDKDLIQFVITLVLVAFALHFCTGCAAATASPPVDCPKVSITEKEYLLLWAETEIMSSCETGKPVEFGTINGQPYFFTCRPGTGI